LSYITEDQMSVMTALVRFIHNYDYFLSVLPVLIQLYISSHPD